MSRKAISEVIAGTGISDLIVYFRTFYSGTSEMVHFKRGGHDILNLSRGIRQGDALSSFCFCLAMDKVQEMLRGQLNGIGIKMWAYLDDLVIAVPHMAQVDMVMGSANDIMKRVDMRMNVAKTQVFNAAASPNASFTVLGSCVSEHYEQYMTQKTSLVTKYAQAFLTSNIHPQILWTFLRMCATVKLVYLFSTNKPQATAKIAAHYDTLMKDIAAKCIGTRTLGDELYERLGGGLPKMTAIAPRLYEESRIAARSGAKMAIPAVCVQNTLTTAPWRAQSDAHWLFWKGRRNSLTSMEFAMAMQIRLRTIPSLASKQPNRCDCGHLITNDLHECEHAFECPRYSNYTFTHRHNAVRDALVEIVSRFGFTTSKEPRYFRYDNDHERPDITFHSYQGDIVTDVSVVQTGSDVGVEAQRKEEEKKKIHMEAVQRTGSKFIPFVMETWGHLGQSCYELIDELSSRLKPYERYSFKEEILHAVQTALAKARVMTLLSKKKE